MHKYLNEKSISLILISFTALFLELAMIRWLPANILSLAYFSNIVLISSFFGLGIGCILASKEKDYFQWFPIILFSIIAIFFSFRWLEVIVPSGGSEWIWSSYTGNNINQSKTTIGITPTLIIVFFLNALVFGIIGQKIGSLLKRFSPLKAYGLDLFGSILGIAIFGFLSFAGGKLSSPPVWFGVVGCVGLFFIRKNKFYFYAGIICVVFTILLVHNFSKNEIWSPYYSIQIKGQGEASVKLFVNRFFHQQAVDFETYPEFAQKYGLAYQLKTPEKVLILGAGTGNDAAVAIMNGVQEIHAVELDPVIADLGKDLHPNSPYQNPKVKVFINDARSFLKKSEEKYDMIILGTLDSHALLSAMSTVRLDNFVYTLESMEEIKKHLNDKGVAVLMFSIPRPWLGEKLTKMVLEVFDDSPPLSYLGENKLFNLMIVAGPGLKDITDKQLSNLPFEKISKTAPSYDLPSDDWPYLYLFERTIPSHYLKTIVILAAVSLLIVFFLLPKGVLNLSGLNFFSLGAAFLLLETKSVTTLSLLFGSTWIVNAFVFGSILTMILLANIIVSKAKIINIKLSYILLGIALLLNYILPAGNFLSESFWTKSILSSLFVSMPLFFAAIIFSCHFKSASNINGLFGVNLMGAVLGGFLEYSSMVGGLNILYLFAGALYLISYWSFTRSQS